MTSVFSKSYIDTQSRINKSAHPLSADQTATHNHAKKFAEVLADIERKDKKLSVSEKLEHHTKPAHRQTNEVISNLQLHEQEHYSVHLPPLISSTSATQKSGSGADSTASFHVNSLDLSVKEVKPEQITQLPLAPETPTVFSGKRIYNTLPIQNIRPSYSSITNIIRKAGRNHGVDPELSIAIAKAESSLRPHAVSRDGHRTKGLFQLLDGTAKEMLVRYRLKDRYDPFDPNLNAYLGVWYLRKLHDIFSRETYLTAGLKTVPAKSADDLEKLAIAAFNAGEGNVALAQAKARSLGKDPANFEDVEPHLPPSTRAYVTKVASIRAALRDPIEIHDIV